MHHPQYLIYRKLRTSDHGQMLINLCCALIGLYITFIIAQHSSFSRILCIIVAALLQYFFLVVFMLMASEAVNLYLKLVIILGSKVPHFTLKATVVSWGKQYTLIFVSEKYYCIIIHSCAPFYCFFLRCSEL